MTRRTDWKKAAKPKPARRPMPVSIDFSKNLSALREIGEAVERHPARVADVLRRWINERQ